MHVDTMNPLKSQQDCPSLEKGTSENGLGSCASKLSGRCYHLEEIFVGVRPFKVIKVRRAMKRVGKSLVKQVSKCTMKNTPIHGMKEASEMGESQDRGFVDWPTPESKKRTFSEFNRQVHSATCSSKL